MSTTSDSPQTPRTDGGNHCASCQAPLGDSYYAANQHALCADCASALQQQQAPKGSRLGRLLKAVLLGAVAAGAGALVQYLVLHLFNINAALVTILIGYMVGAAVRSGSGGRGGWRYQAIAVVLTYLAIGAAYVPLAVAELKADQERKEAGLPDPAKFNAQNLRAKKVTTVKPTPAPAAEPAEPASLPVLIIAVIVGLFVLPVSVGMSSPLSILIFGFGLFQAWKMNKATTVAVTGPHGRSAPAPPLAM